MLSPSKLPPTPPNALPLRQEVWVPRKTKVEPVSAGPTPAPGSFSPAQPDGAGGSARKVIHSKNLLRSGTLVGSFKMDVGTVYSQPGE